MTDYRPDDPRLPPRRPVDGVTFCGLLRAMDVKVWYRRHSQAHTNSPASWRPGAEFPFVIEVDMWTLDRDDPRKRIAVTVTWPSQHGPDQPVMWHDAVRCALLRALCHEVDEGLIVHGVRKFDPHLLPEARFTRGGA